jgi:hypothetical protein
MQALEVLVNGSSAFSSLCALLVVLPRHAAAVLRHAQVDPSCKLCSSNGDSNTTNTEPKHQSCAAAETVLHLLDSMAATASYTQLQELLLRLLQLAVSKRVSLCVAEGAALALHHMSHAAESIEKDNRW